MFPCPSFKYRADYKDNTQKLKTEFLSDNDDVAIEEYFETDAKSEVDSDSELDRSKE